MKTSSPSVDVFIPEYSEDGLAGVDSSCTFISNQKGSDVLKNKTITT